MRATVVFCAVAGTLAITSHARAQAAGVAASAEVTARFEQTLSLDADEERRGQWLVASGFVGAGVGLAAGALLSSEDAAVARFVAAVSVAGAATFAAMMLSARGPLVELRDEHRQMLRSGVTPGDAMRRAEARWREYVEWERAHRPPRGRITIALGASMIALSLTTLALYPNRNLGDYTTELALSVAGVSFAVAGVVQLMTPVGLVEESLRRWQAERARDSARVRLRAPALAASAQGASIVLGGTF